MKDSGIDLNVTEAELESLLTIFIETPYAVANRINGSMSLWSPMKKPNLKTFKIQVKSVKSKPGENVIQLKELERCIGEYEFSVVPKSLLTEDSVTLACKDKSTIMNIIKNLENPEVQILGNAPANFTLIICFMAKIVKGKSMKTLHIPMFFVLFYYPKSDSQ